MGKHPADLYKDHLKPFLRSKTEEFRILGYDDIEIEELWSYLLNKKWKNRNERTELGYTGRAAPCSGESRERE